jgi:DNA repair exonuclease SbcCD nuclease subunit
MNTLKIIHIGDMHLLPKYEVKTEPALEQILSHCNDNKIDAVIIPGDLLHEVQKFSEASALPQLYRFLRRLSKKVAFIFIVKGNNQHDAPGSIALLHQLEPNIYAYEYPVVLGVEIVTGGVAVYDLLKDDLPFPAPTYICSLIPYPTKSMFVSEQSIDNNNSDFLEKFEQIFELIGDITKEYSCPKILGFHGNVVGSRLSTGQTLQSQDIMVVPSTLDKAKADYYALNHIHLRQEVAPNKVYAGGIANCNWGETEQKSIEEIIFRKHSTRDVWASMEKKTIPLTASRPMIKLEGRFIGEKFNLNLAGLETLSGELLPVCEYRLRIEVFENDRKLITDDKIQSLKNNFGQDAKIEFNIVPTVRESRSEEIMKCITLKDEVGEYANVIGAEISTSIDKKVAQIQEEVAL